MKRRRSRPVRQFALRAYWCAGASATLYRATILAKREFAPYEWPAGASHVVSTTPKRPSRWSYYLSLLKMLFATTTILADQPPWRVRLRSAKNGNGNHPYIRAASGFRVSRCCNAACSAIHGPVRKHIHRSKPTGRAPRRIKQSAQVPL